MKKRLFALLLALCLIVGLLAGCSNNTTPADDTNDDQAEDTTTPDTTPDADDTQDTDDQDEDEDDTQSDAEDSYIYDLAYDYFASFPSDKNVISSADLFELMDAEEDMFILDIRRAADYEENHLKGAVNLSFFETEISDNLDKIPDDCYVMVYCYTGQTASQVTALLNVAGKTAKNIQSGYNNGISQTEGYEAYLETEANDLPDGSYPVDARIQEVMDAYFTDKMAQDGTIYANFNVSAETVNTIVEEELDEYLILSIRQAADYEEGHIAGAINIPYGQGMQEELAKLPVDQKIVVYCYSGQTSSQTTAILRLMGYDAYSMSGGMNAWVDAGYDTVTD